MGGGAGGWSWREAGEEEGGSLVSTGKRVPEPVTGQLAQGPVADRTCMDLGKL